MGYGCHIESDAVLGCIPGQISLCKVYVVVGDDTVGDPISADDVGNKSDYSRPVQFLDWSCLNPLGELVDCDQKVGQAASCCLEWSNRVQSPYRKRPCYWDCLECRCWEVTHCFECWQPLQCLTRCSEAARAVGQ